MICSNRVWSFFLISVNSLSSILPPESVNQYNLNGLALENRGTITSIEFAIPDGFSGVVFDSWVKGNYAFELVGSLDNRLDYKTGSTTTPDTISYQGLVRLSGTGTVKLKVSGSGLISISQLGLYQEEI